MTVGRKRIKTSDNAVEALWKLATVLCNKVLDVYPSKSWTAWCEIPFGGRIDEKKTTCKWTVQHESGFVIKY